MTGIVPAWVVVDDRYPDYSVEFEPTCAPDAIEVRLTSAQVALVWQYKQAQEKFIALCESLTRKGNE